MSPQHYQPPHAQIPVGATGRILPLNIEVRSLLEYDVDYMRDQVRSEVFINGMPTNVSAVAVADDIYNFTYNFAGAREAFLRLAPEVERMAVQEFVGVDHRRRLDALRRQYLDLRDYVERDRWWQFQPVRRWARNLRNSLRRGDR